MVFLRTQRLILRNLELIDGETICKYRNNENCARYQRWADTSLSAVICMIEKYRSDLFLSQQEEQHYAISLSDRTCIGDLSYFYSTKDNCITLGITISPEYQRKGYAYEILQEVIAAIQEKYPGADIVALIDPENDRSMGLFSKLGFVQECYAPSISSCVYTIYGKN